MLEREGEGADGGPCPGWWSLIIQRNHQDGVLLEFVNMYKEPLPCARGRSDTTG